MTGNNGIIKIKLDDKSRDFGACAVKVPHLISFEMKINLELALCATAAAAATKIE